MRDLDQVICNIRVLLLDFDGPVCRVFAGLPASVVASELRAYLLQQGVEPPDNLDSNPFKLLAWVGQHHPHLSRAVDDQLRNAESHAIESAAPTRHTENVMTAAGRRGIVIAIVSNNASEAIQRYLAAHGLADRVALVVGRVPGDPGLLKPNPHSVRRAIDELGVRPSDCVLVGDSAADVIASRAVGVHPVGFAKTPERGPGLVAAGAEAVIDSMGDLAACLDAA